MDGLKFLVQAVEGKGRRGMVWSAARGRMRLAGGKGRYIQVVVRIYKEYMCGSTRRLSEKA